MSNIKRCSDCANFRPSSNVDGQSEQHRYGTCHAPQNFEENNALVSDRITEPDLRYQFCSVHRDAGWLAARMIGTCGRGGRWFVRAQIETIEQQQEAA